MTHELVDLIDTSDAILYVIAMITGANMTEYSQIKISVVGA